MTDDVSRHLVCLEVTLLSFTQPSGQERDAQSTEAILPAQTLISPPVPPTESPSQGGKGHGPQKQTEGKEKGPGEREEREKPNLRTRNKRLCQSASRYSRSAQRLQRPRRSISRFPRLSSCTSVLQCSAQGTYRNLYTCTDPVLQ